ncbi:helix-turn-helix transcriptional regulator [Desulfoluna spongiiphila]|uniref:DNA-binding transcriptional regulator, CsgD family n=1 Tax=Desulfoluna spongiiphila TaxID=419481 RepID=A0A1G5HPP7_9BACT|nr:helix-turn-helix transcriptional regulator [Desulfoluna spongiiphila]SCY65842.1 DNA-binding transcriptional regulator, CsgD family [Desulfoluna spongiiphila]
MFYKGFLKATAGLALYLVWLNAIPLEGVLLPSWADSLHVYHFLSVHSAALFLCSRLSASFLNDVSRYAFPLLGVLSASLLVVTSHTAILFMVMGALAAPLVVGVMNALRAAPQPLFAAAIACVAGNLIPFSIYWLPVGLPLKVGGISVMMFLTGIWMQASDSLSTDRTESTASSPVLWVRPFLAVYLLFAVFYVTGGLMHGYISPALTEAGDTSRLYIFAYLAMLPLTVYVLKKSHDAAIYLAVILGIIAFSMVAFNSLLLLQIGMFASYASFGVFDLLVIALVIAPKRTLSEQFCMMGAMCGGIFLGSLIVTLFSPYLSFLIVVANVVLVLTLALFSHLKIQVLVHRQGNRGDEEPSSILAELLPKGLLKRISEKERAVLSHVVAGKTYKETAKLEGIAESTVKTYMQRLFQKFDCKNRKELLEKVYAYGASSEESPRVPKSMDLS